MQRVYAVITTEGHAFKPSNLFEVIPENKHWKNEKEVAKALRRLADQIETGCSFELVKFGEWK